MMRAPPALSPGARVGVFAPSGGWTPAWLEAGLEILRGWGLEPVLGPNVGRRCRYLAGTDAERLADLEWALRAPDLDAAWMLRGGYGLTRLLDAVRWRGLPRRPVLGFSDGTALAVALRQRARRLFVHGPVVQSLGQVDEGSRGHLRALLFGQPTAPMAGRALTPGQVEAPLVGGNLCMLATLCGTRDQLRARGCVLVLEDVAEPAYKVDRMLQQLRLAGVLEGIAGVALGEFSGPPLPEGADWTLDDVFLDHFGALGVPVVAGLPIGHGAQNRAWLYGGRAVLGPQGLCLAQGLAAAGARVG